MSQINGRFHSTSPHFTLNVEFSFPADGVTALFGPSGCGKTTFLRYLAGLDICSLGSLSVKGNSWQSTDVFLPTFRRAVGYVFQNGHLFDHLPVKKNLEFGLNRTPESERRLDFSQVTRFLSLESLLERSPRQLSGGQRQRVAMGMALLASPQLLLMDEPLSGLDETSKSEILPFIARMSAELQVPIIYVSHSLNEVVQIADHLVLMDRGQFVSEGPIGEMLTDLEGPLAQADEAESLIEGAVQSYDSENHLLLTRFSGGEFLIPGHETPPGQRVRLRIQARDVSLTLDKPTSSTILNVLPAEAVEMREHGAAQITVKLRLGETPLLARVTRKSAQTLALEPGKRLFVQVKSVSARHC